MIVVIAYGVARLLAHLIEPICEQKVRMVKGKPGLMRWLVALLRNTQWILFFLLLLSTYHLMQALTWPSRSYFIGIVAKLALAWMIISVLSKAIRNRTLARTVAYFCWIFAALWMLGQVDNVTELMDSIAFSIGDFRLSVLRLAKGFVLVIGLLWLAGIVGKYLDRKVQQVEDLNPSLQVLTGKFIRVILVIIALVVALSSIGIDLTALTFFSGALGVGIGFGMRAVISNFISGIIILMDKSIKPGDTISLGDTFGWIRELRGRFISVITRDGKEFLIPNEDLITQQVINWSFTDKMIRLDVPFGVSYDSDPHEVSRIAIEACGSVERIPKTRAPVCWMTEFGDSSLNFLLRFWIEDPQNGLTNIRGKVMLALWDEFKKNGIGIPYPHREVILKNASSPTPAFQIDTPEQVKNRE